MTLPEHVRPVVRTVRVDDEADLHAWWTTGHEATLADRGYDAWPPWELSRRALPRRRSDQRVVLLGARLDGSGIDPGADDEAGPEVGAALVVLPMLDDTGAAHVSVWTRPGRRRRGCGTALLAAAEQVAAGHGRRLLRAEAQSPVAARGPGESFAVRHGYAVVEENDAKLLDLADAPSSWPALDAEVAARRGAHEVVLSVDRVPEEHVEGLCALLSVFVGMLPDGDAERTEAVWDVDRLRAGEARNKANDRRQVIALAVAADGVVVGFSDLRVDTPSSPVAGVGGTLVLPAHRGHGLGAALKLATHRRLLDLRAEGGVSCTHVETQNATSNDAMNRVNEALGYRVVEREIELQKRLDLPSRRGPVGAVGV